MTALSAANIESIASAPDGPRKLRALLLDLAVRGLLSRPLSGDDSADNLLEQIQLGREGLVAAGLLKFKELPAVRSDETPHQLPAHWVWTRLGEITNYGATAKADCIPDDAWLLELEDIERETSRLLRRVRFIERGSLSDKNAFKRGDVLYCKLRPYLNKVVVADEDGFCTTEILPLRCHGNWVPEYFQLALMSPFFLGYVNTKSYGMKMPRLGTEDGRMATFPLPPLAEQHRIVAKVHELMALCDRLEARQQDAEAAHARLVQALLDSLTQARDADEFQACWQRVARLFESLFTTDESIDCLLRSCIQWALAGRFATHVPSDEPASSFVMRAVLARQEALGARGRKIAGAASEAATPDRTASGMPENWCRCRVDEIAECLDYRRRPINKAEREGRVGLVPYYGANGQVGWVDEHLFDEDLVLVVEDETFIGRTKPFSYVVQGKSWVNNHAHVLRPLAGMSAQYLNLCLHRYDFVPLTSGTTGRRKLTQAGLNGAEITIAPLAEQARIVAKVEELSVLCDQLKARIAAARAKHAQLAEALVAQAVAA